MANSAIGGLWYSGHGPVYVGNASLAELTPYTISTYELARYLLWTIDVNPYVVRTYEAGGPGLNQRNPIHCNSLWLMYYLRLPPKAGQ